MARLWHIDSFEGGKGSRAAFLKSVASSYGKNNENAFVLVSSYTKEGAAKAFAEGEYPDMLSFSVGVFPPAERCRPLSLFSFSPSACGKSQLALPWCKGGYVLYALSEDAPPPSSENTVVSSGGSNAPEIAACLESLAFSKSEDSVRAYVDFLAGKYRWLLGTQRDYYRFLSRGVNVYGVPVSSYNDLYQYICVMTDDEKTASVCDGFLKTLFSEKTQKSLTKIGMASVVTEVYEEGILHESEKEKTQYFSSAFASEESLEKMRKTAKEGNAEVLRKFLKSG